MSEPLDVKSSPLTASAGNRLKYKEYSPHIEVSFWYELEHRKLHDWRVQEPVVPLTLFGAVNVASAAASANMITVRRESLGNDTRTIAARLQETHAGAPLSTPILVKGILQNFNTVEQLQHLPRQETLWGFLQEHLLIPLLPSHSSKEDNEVDHDDEADTLLQEKAWEEMNFAFTALFTYADLKNHRFHYMMAFPVIDLGSPVYVKHRLKGGYAAVAVDSSVSCFPTRAAVNDVHAHLLDSLRRHPERGPNPFIVACGAAGDSDEQQVRFLPFTPCSIKQMKGAQIVIAMADVSTAEDFPCWSARNVIGVLRLVCPSITTFVLYCIRHNDVEQSILFDCFCDPLDYTLREAAAAAQGQETEEKTKEVPIRALGWIKRKTATSAVHSIDLGAMMVPERLAESSARLNLNLMKWRMLPELSLDGLARCRALILGSGTLGCNVARQLLMWGVTNITFVDRGNVSFSNLGRQTLYEMTDVTNPEESKRNKAVAAANALKRILPTVGAQGVPLTIHMPGHRIDKQREPEMFAEVEKLDRLIQEHDVVFLLTDSREARWLPTVMASAHNKPLLNVALGFDTYVVMRHGIELKEGSGRRRLGCYFCSDVVAPRDSMTARTLDQQCTVTRPGVSAIASATAVELLAQLYNHPLGFACPPFTEDGAQQEWDVSAAGSQKTHDAVCALGVVPHQIRGSVLRHSTYTLYGYQYELCAACSDAVVDAYRSDGTSFVLRCVNNPLYIEEVSGIKTFKEGFDLENIDEWDSDSSGD